MVEFSALTVFIIALSSLKNCPTASDKAGSNSSMFSLASFFPLPPRTPGTGAFCNPRGSRCAAVRGPGPAGSAGAGRGPVLDAVGFFAVLAASVMFAPEADDAVGVTLLSSVAGELKVRKHHNRQ